MALTKQGLYRHVWPDWKKIFQDSDDLIELMLYLEDTFDAKIPDGALRKELSGTVATLSLKFNYHWNERARGNNNPLVQKNYPG
jgi:hypothetical protein